MEGEQEKENLPAKIPSKWRSPKRLIFISIIAVIIVTLILFVVFILPLLGHDGSMKVQSDSMQHNKSGGKSGIIDYGDTVFYDKIDDRNDVKTYFQGKRQGYKKYGEYGDVIIYYKNGYRDTIPVIHRAIIWLEYNETSGSFDIPELSKHDSPEDWEVLGGEHRWYNLSGMIILKDVGYDHEDVNIDLGHILAIYDSHETEPHSGFITLGDHNGNHYDQRSLNDGHGGIVRPVRPEWIVGKVTYLVDA